MAKIDSTGFVQKTQNEYFADLRSRYLDIDPAWNLDPSSPDGLKLAGDSELWANLDEALAAAYNSKDPDRAMGSDLNALLQISNLTRLAGSGSLVTLSLTGVDGTVIPAGKRAKSNIDGSFWATDVDVTISSGVAYVPATCTVPGPTAADPGDISIISDPVGGWQSVTNLTPASVGIAPETDSRARLRRNGSTAKPGQNQVDATFAEIANLPGVARVKIYENSTGIIDANGLPPHSTNIIVDGGDSSQIARAIYSKRNPGPIQHHSATPVDIDVTSLVTGNTQAIRFDRPLYIDSNVVVSVTSDGSLPGNADQLIKDAIIRYSVGEIDGVVSAFNQTGYNIGDSVYSGQLHTPVNSVIGAYGHSFVSSITIANGQQQLLIPFHGISRWSDGNITVNII